MAWRGGRDGWRVLVGRNWKVGSGKPVKNIGVLKIGGISVFPSPPSPFPPAPSPPIGRLHSHLCRFTLPTPQQGEDCRRPFVVRAMHHGNLFLLARSSLAATSFSRVCRLPAPPRRRKSKVTASIVFCPSGGFTFFCLSDVSLTSGTHRFVFCPSRCFDRLARPCSSYCRRGD